MEKGGPMANTHSHLTLSDRIYIEQALERRMKFKDIAMFIGKDPTTVSKEIRRHRSAKESGRKTALCENRSTCTKQHMCHQSYCIIAILTAKITLPQYADDLLRRLMFAMAVGSGTAGRI